MKKALTFLVLAVAILTTSCIKEANAPENEMTTCPATGLPSTYLGKWKLAGERSLQAKANGKLLAMALSLT